MQQLKIEYYPIVKKWNKIKKYINSPEVQEILVSDFNKFTYGKWGMEFKHGMKPIEFETCDWSWDKKGRKPAYWDYVKHSACHWVVNFNLKLAQLAEPKKEWRILTSQKHSTVWDGNCTLFDMNFLALGIDANDAFNLAKHKELKVGKKLTVYFATKK